MLSACDQNCFAIIKGTMQFVTQDRPAFTSNSATFRRELQALIAGCGVYELDRAPISLTGADRVRWLNGMVSNNIRDLAVGHGVYAFVLNPQGHIQADLYIFNRGESLTGVTERAQVETVLQIFRRYIIMDKVGIEDRSEKVTGLGVAGPKSSDALAVFGFNSNDLGALQFTELSWNGIGITLVRGDNPCVPNYELWVPTESAESVWNALLQAGALEVHTNALETFRIACGIPKVGQDIRQRDLPQETGQERALNFSKGCYIGQEIVERIRARGAVHRMFTGFEVEGQKPLPGFRIQAEGKDAVELTSIATVPVGSGERTLALGYGRREVIAPEKEFMAGDTKLRVVTLPFPGIFARN
jgi:folate-binding protein YgfZ